MLKTVLQITLLSLAMHTAFAADTCAFRPRANGGIDGYIEPKPGETADGEKLIAGLPDDFAANRANSFTTNSVMLAYYRRGVWTLRRAGAKDAPVLAFVSGPELLAARWQPEYGRSAKTMLLESLRSGRKMQLIAAGECF